MTAVATMFDRMKALSEKAKRMGVQQTSEEATKTALVMPFLLALGYDVFNPDEVIPAFSTEGEPLRQPERVDYAIKWNGEVIIVVETKKLGSNLEHQEGDSLSRCFSAAHARIALLTNGARYAFFSDLDEPSKLDRRPFLEIDLLALRETLVSEVSRLAKDVFDPDEWATA
jgi:hypothetical protein